MAEISIGKSDVLWSYAGTFFRVCTNVILLPLLVYYLSAEELGLWYVYASIAQLVVLMDFGFAPTFARNISYVWSGAKELKTENINVLEKYETDWYEFKTILQSCRLVYILISLVAFLLLLTFGTLYINNISGNAYLISWFIYSAAVFLNVLYGYYTSFLRGVGAVAENNKAAIISKITQLILTYLLLLLGTGITGVAVAYLASGLLLRIVSKYYFEHYEEIGYNLKQTILTEYISKCIEKIKVIWFNASKDGLVTLSNYLSTQANTLICSSVIGLVATGSYGISIQIATLVSSISGIPFSTFQTKMQSNAIKGDIPSNYKLFSRSMVLYVLCFFILSAGSFLCFPLLSLVKDSFSINLLLYSAILIQTIIYGLYSLSASFISSYNIIPYTKAFVVSSMVSVCLSYLLSKYTDLGTWALVMSPIIVSLYNLWKWPNFVLSNILKTNMYEFIKNGIYNCKSLKI